ncbi:hypothetical protein V8C86DRAFT_2447270, partial [Haematococcus lacustris]
ALWFLAVRSPGAARAEPTTTPATLCATILDAAYATCCRGRGFTLEGSGNGVLHSAWHGMSGSQLSSTSVLALASVVEHAIALGTKAVAGQHQKDVLKLEHRGGDNMHQLVTLVVHASPLSSTVVGLDVVLSCGDDDTRVVEHAIALGTKAVAGQHQKDVLKLEHRGGDNMHQLVTLVVHASPLSSTVVGLDVVLSCGDDDTRVVEHAIALGTKAVAGQHQKDVLKLEHRGGDNMHQLVTLVVHASPLSSTVVGLDVVLSCGDDDTRVVEHAIALGTKAVAGQHQKDVLKLEHRGGDNMHQLVTLVVHASPLSSTVVGLDVVLSCGDDDTRVVEHAIALGTKAVAGQHQKDVLKLEHRGGDNMHQLVTLVVHASPLSSREHLPTVMGTLDKVAVKWGT